MQSAETLQLVQDRYGELAERSPTAKSQDYQKNVAQAFGYDPNDLITLPQNANLGVSCGNPLATANLRQGETVIDLGSGGGMDIILAANKVGPKGKAIGVDMTKEMLNLARENVKRAGIPNASFVEGSITAIPVADSTADCIISNCVINLVPSEQKNLVFREMFRLLKPGGRVAISDILARRKLPAEVTSDLSLYVGCIAGASQVEEYDSYLREAGFNDIMIVDTKSDLNVYKDMTQESKKPSCCGTSSSNSGTSADAWERDFNEWAGSFQIYAVKAR